MQLLVNCFLLWRLELMELVMKSFLVFLVDVFFGLLYSCFRNKLQICCIIFFIVNNFLKIVVYFIIRL